MRINSYVCYLFEQSQRTFFPLNRITPESNRIELSWGDEAQFIAATLKQNQECELNEAKSFTVEFI